MLIALIACCLGSRSKRSRSAIRSTSEPYADRIEGLQIERRGVGGRLVGGLDVMEWEHRIEYFLCKDRKDRIVWDDSGQDCPADKMRPLPILGVGERPQPHLPSSLGRTTSMATTARLA